MIGEQQGRMTAQLKTFLDRKVEGMVLVGAIPRQDRLDVALRMLGRLEAEVNIRTPDLVDREDILAVLMDRLGLQLAKTWL